MLWCLLISFFILDVLGIKLYCPTLFRCMPFVILYINQVFVCHNTMHYSGITWMKIQFMCLYKVEGKVKWNIEQIINIIIEISTCKKLWMLNGIKFRIIHPAVDKKWSNVLPQWLHNISTPSLGNKTYVFTFIF